MFIKINFQSEIPIYLQLYQEIIKGIAMKKLLAGEPLPSVRVLSEDLGINMHTVNKAYTLLKQEGFIQIHRQKGIEINPDGMPPADDAYMILLHEKLEPLIAESIAKGLTKDDFIKKCANLFDYYQEESDKKWILK